MKINKGSVHIYRVFDIAEEIDLRKLDDIILSEKNSLGRLKISRNPREWIVMRNAPVHFTAGEVTLQLFGQPVRADILGKVWDYGVISIQFVIPIPSKTTWDELIEVSATLDKDQSIDQIARSKATLITETIQTSLMDPHHWEEFEDYTIFFFEELEGIKNANDLLHQADAAKLIVAENQVELAEQSKKSILESTLQYSEQDLTIIDWNAAIVVEPSGRKEIPEVIEFALTHMMEMRYYDALLDHHLSTLYDAVEESRTRYFSNRFSDLSREASARYIEFSEFIERVDNSFKVVGDFYLAKIFRTAGEEFRIPEWESNIMRKMKLLANLSELLQGELNVNRSLWLEITIVVLILFEIIAAYFKITSH